MRPGHSEARIRDELLKHTPIGSSFSNVLEFARNHLKYVGPAPYIGGPVSRHWPPPSKSVGVRTVGVCLGSYGFPGRTDTYLHWAFDKDDKLIDIVVSKERESL